MSDETRTEETADERRMGRGPVMGGTRVAGLLCVALLAVGCSEEPPPPREQLTAKGFCIDFQAHYRQWDTTRRDLWVTGPERLAAAAQGDPKAAALKESLVRFETP